jgi:hypothetical protein
VQAFASRTLRAAVEAGGEPAAEDLTWLDVDLGGDLPTYDWGPGEPPQGRPVRWVPGQGLDARMPADALAPGDVMEVALG